MVFKENKKHLKIPNSRMDYLQRESFYWDHRPSLFQGTGYRFNSDKMSKRSNYIYKDSMENSNDYQTFFASKTYSNVNSSILSYIVGGFVGSKIQMNTPKKHNLSYDLSAAISNLLNPWKFDSEKTTLKRNGENLCGMPSKIQPDCYEKYIIEKSRGETKNEKSKNCLMDVVDIECLISIPFKEFVEDQNCLLDMNKTDSESQIEGNNMNTFNLSDTKFCDMNQVNSTNKSMQNSKCIDNDKLDLKTMEIEVQSLICNRENNKKLDEFQGIENYSKLTVCSDKISDKSKVIESPSCETFQKKNCTTIECLLTVPNKQDSHVKHSNNYLATERFRQQSECSIESTDSESFIVFEDQYDNEDENDKNYSKSHKNIHFCDMENLSDDNEDDEEEDEEDDSDIDEENEDDYIESSSSDEYDFCSVNNNILLANDKWLRNYNDVIVDENESLKKVKFNEKVKVNKIVAWDHAYRTARLGPWEQLARDRVRFQEKISRLSLIISPILSMEHRDKIYNKLHS